jgi:hypothetical protein
MYVIIYKHWGKPVSTTAWDDRAMVTFANGKKKILNIRYNNCGQLQREKHNNNTYKYEVDFNAPEVITISDDSESDTEVQYNVQAILAHKKKGYEYVYKIKWSGYEETSWEPEKNLYCQEMLIAYNMKNNLY